MSQDSSNADIKVQAVEKYMQAFEEGSLDIIRDIYAADAVVEDPVGSDPYVGIDAICAFYESAFNMNAKLSLNGVVRSAGDSCAFTFTVDAGGMKISPIDVFEFNEAGKVIKMKAYWGPENIVS